MILNYRVDGENIGIQQILLVQSLIPYINQKIMNFDLTMF